MRNIILFTTTLVLICFQAPAFAKDRALPEVILAGDSWAALPCLFGSAQTAFFNRHIEVDIHDCLKTSHVGGRADNFRGDKAYLETMKRLQNNPHVKAVYLSLGGNDMFKYWHKDMSAQDEATLFNNIRTSAQNIINDFHHIRPDVWVLLSGYDIVYMYANNPIKAYRDIFEHMGNPTTLDVNTAFTRLNAELVKIQGDHTVFQHHIGLMQYYYGVPEAGLGSKKTLPPGQISSLNEPLKTGGVLTARNNKIAMAHIFNWYTDPHHLRPHGFMKLFEHAVDGYMSGWLKGKTSVENISEIDDDNGEVTSDLEAEGAEMAQQEFSE